MIEDRDPVFWRGVFDHPAVKPHLSLGHDVDLAQAVTHPGVLPLRDTHGGYLFVRLDAFGLVRELHAAFTPDGWGREASALLKAALEQVFSSAHIVTVPERGAWWRSRPPKSFGFRPAADFTDTGLGPIRTWILTRAAWEQSPARRRM